MTEKKPSPRPWRHSKDAGELGRIVDAEERDVAQTQDTGRGDGAQRNQQRDIDAAHIVHVVNTYDEVVAALQELRGGLRCESIDAVVMGACPRRYGERGMLLCACGPCEQAVRVDAVLAAAKVKP